MQAQKMVAEAHLVAIEVADKLIYEVYRGKGIATERQMGQLQLVPVDPEVLQAVSETKSQTKSPGNTGYSGSGDVRGGDGRADQQVESTETQLGNQSAEVQDQEFELDFDAVVTEEECQPNRRDKFYHQDWNWVLCTSGEAERIVNWYNPSTKAWDGPVPEFVVEHKEKMLSRITQARQILSMNQQ